MPFRRFFDRSAKRPVAEEEASDAPAPETEAEYSDDAEASDDSEEGEDAAPEDAPDIDWRARAAAVLPTGASTGSKRPAALYGAEDASGPTHYSQAAGCRVIDSDGTTYVDCTMALGSVALGYGEPRVTRAVVEAAGEGHVGALSSWREVELAERLHTLIPCAERVQFLKSGAEAASAAVRIARTYTGRDRVVASGYFGWHDWASEQAGVPAAVLAATRHVLFDDVETLERAVAEAGDGLAAVVIEPVVERTPSEAWLRRARELCDARGAVLVFDEVKTGFRLAPGGYQEVCGITPDLATFGKALANGYPLAAVVGHAAVMDAARNTWISSTLASEATALAAALAVLDWHEEADVCATLAETGREMRAALDRAIDASGVGAVSTEGLDPMFLLRWDDPKREARFLAECARAGVIVKRGAYNFAAVAHDEEAIQEIEAAVSSALVTLGDWERSG